MPGPLPQRSSRQESEVVDLTSSPTMSTRRKRSAAEISTSTSTSTSSRPEVPPSRPLASTAAAGPSTHKRQRTDHDRQERRLSGSSGGSSTRPKSRLQPEASIEEINLVDDEDPLSETLQRQREAQIKEQSKAQAGEEEKEPKLNRLTCAICLEQPTELTATVCGHLFCGECLHASLVASARTQNGESRKASCPICRKTINNKATSKQPKQTVPLAIMTRGVLKGKSQAAKSMTVA